LRAVFRIGQPIDEARNEPLFLADPRGAPRPRLSASPAPIADDFVADRCEPAPPVAEPQPPGSATLPDGEQPVEAETRRQPFGPIVSLILHLLPLLLLIDWPMHPPAEVTAIPVQLVFQPPPPPLPPPPKPASRPRPKTETRRPPGRLASADMGDTKAKGQDQAKSEEPTPNKQPPAEESPLEAPPKLASIDPPLLPAPPKLTVPDPMDTFAPKPLRKPAPAVHQAVVRVPQRAHLMPRSARLPGPSASRDEYLAYVNSLILRHLGLVSQALVSGRRGETVVDILVLDDGTLAMLRVGQSSGYPDIDLRVEEMIRAVGRFPPLPQWIQGPNVWLGFTFPFPGGIED
jgi:TonB family protein